MKRAERERERGKSETKASKVMMLSHENRLIHLEFLTVISFNVIRLFPLICFFSSFSASLHSWTAAATTTLRHHSQDPHDNNSKEKGSIFTYWRFYSNVACVVVVCVCVFFFSLLISLPLSLGLVYFNKLSFVSSHTSTFIKLPHHHHHSTLTYGT